MQLHLAIKWKSASQLSLSSENQYLWMFFKTRYFVRRSESFGGEFQIASVGNYEITGKIRWKFPIKRRIRGWFKCDVGKCGWYLFWKF